MGTFGKNTDTITYLKQFCTKQDAINHKGSIKRPLHTHFTVSETTGNLYSVDTMLGF